MITAKTGFNDDDWLSCNIGLGSPHFGQGVYFNELLTGLPSMMPGSLL
jgi:hypothetical protein